MNIFFNHSFRFIALTITVVGLLITGCTSKQNKPDVAANANEAKLYSTAQKALERGAFQDAIDSLQAMEKTYPFGEYSKSAQLSLIYAYFSYDEPESASAAANRFIRLHPKHPNIDYAYYMKGLINFPQAKTIFQRFFNVDISQRDVNEAKTSFKHFTLLAQRFPNSEYAPDALKRMEFLRNLIARHEIHVANYYLKRKAYLAAANRGRYVVENFQQTPSVPDALAVMAQGYYSMGMQDLAENSISTLRANFPDHPTLNDNGVFDFDYYTRASDTWLDTVTLGLLGRARAQGFNSEEQYNSPADKQVVK